MARILVTGGAGYIGSHVVYELIDRGYDVTILDDMSLGNEENIDPRSEFVKGTTLSMIDLEAVCKTGFDGVIHLAAFKAAGESMVNPGKYSINNVTGTLNLINVCCRYNINNFIFSSTASVYGIPKFIPMDENHPVNPVNYYGATKLMIENNLEWFSRLKGLRFAALRYFNAAGYDLKGRISGLERNPQNLIPIVMEVASGKRKKMEVFGNDYNTIDGTGIRDYIHVSDLAIAHIQAYEYLEIKKKDLTVNLGTGSGLSVLEIIKKAEEISGNNIEFEVTDRRPGDSGTVIASFEKANKIIGWQPENSNLNTMLESTWEVYKKPEKKKTFNF